MDKLNSDFKETYLKPGVYKIINIVNNKFYIGSCSVSRGIYYRLLSHRRELNNNKHINRYLQTSYNKYGADNFYCEIIELCEPNKCIEREQYWIDLLKPDYNLYKIAGSPKGSKHTSETKVQLSKKRIAFWKDSTNREKMKVGMLGKKRTEQGRKNISIARKKIGFKVSTKNREALNKAVCKEILQYTKEMILIKEWKSITTASKELNIFGQNICRAIKNNTFCAGYKWRYKNEQ